MGAPALDPGVAGAVRSARRLNEPRPALVEEHVDGTPSRVNRQGVALVREEWRVVDRWWTEEPLSRRYFDVVLETGQRRSSSATRSARAGSPRRASDQPTKNARPVATTSSTPMKEARRFIGIVLFDGDVAIPQRRSMPKGFA